MNICQEENCSVSIMAGHKLCRRHHKAAKKARVKARTKNTSRGGVRRIHGADGKVRPNEGLAYWKEMDRRKWVARQTEMILSIGMAFRSLAGLDKAA